MELQDISQRSDAYRRQMASVNPHVGYTMASATWPGLGKVVEEAGEVLQIGGKIMAAHGSSTYFNGEDMRKEMTKEIADLIAAVTFLIDENGLDKLAISRRTQKKLKKYYAWKASNE